MRICFLADGQSIHTKRWCMHFAQLGHEVHLITFRKGEIGNTTVHHIDAGSITDAGGNWRILFQGGEVKKILNRIKPDILHAHYATSYGIAGAMSGFHPLVVTALGSDVLVSPQNSILYRILIKYVFKKADWVTAMANHMKEVIVKLGIDRKKVSTVVFGIDPMIFNHAGRKVSSHQFVITSSRNLELIYNIELLLRALPLVKDKIPNLTVNLIGQGSLLGKLKAMVEDGGLKDHVKFLGKLDQKEIAQTLNSSQLFVTASLSDGNNVSLTEAMACGTVSIATDIPANRQWINEGVNGFLVPTDKPEVLADRILYVYYNYSELERKTIPYNDTIIEEKALWTTNMAVVEKKYRELVKNSNS